MSTWDAIQWLHTRLMNRLSGEKIFSVIEITPDVVVVRDGGDFHAHVLKYKKELCPLLFLQENAKIHFRYRCWLFVRKLYYFVYNWALCIVKSQVPLRIFNIAATEFAKNGEIGRMIASSTYYINYLLKKNSYPW